MKGGANNLSPSIGLIRASWKSIPASALCMARDEDEFSYMSYMYLTFLHKCLNFNQVYLEVARVLEPSPSGPWEGTC